MKLKKQKRHYNLSALAPLVLLLFLAAGGCFFTTYLKQQIFIERSTQLESLTAQVRVTLDNALDAHWNYLTTAVNILETKTYASKKELVQEVKELEHLLDTDSYDSTLMLLDSNGNYYDALGEHGVWSNISLISGERKRYTHIFENYLSDGSHWSFVQELESPVRTADGIVFTHAVLLKDVQTLAQYYDSDAYGSQNETYILKSNGTRMHDNISRNNTIQSYNVLKTLEQMDGQTCPDLLAVLAETDTFCTNFWLEGQEYYYCIASLNEYDTLILFLIPAKFVASGTVAMVEAVIRTLLLLAAAVLLLMLLAATAIVRQQSSVQLIRQEQENLRRQEELNAQLTQSKESAEQAFQIAEDANRAKSSFLSSMSHDIRTPMNAIVGFSTLLARDAENPEKVRAYTRKITSSSQHLLGLINDILDISKIEAGKTSLNLSEENIENLIEGIDGIIRPQMKAKGHTFEVYAKDLKHEWLVMDQLRLNQILLNLLSNAVKYTPDGGHITLTVQEFPQTAEQLAYYRFIVADNGYGMSEEYQQKLFKAFTREEDSVTSKIQGTGLGMAITKNLIDLMGGSIHVESEKGKGSTFTVDVELRIGKQAVEPNFWKNHGITRILAVDDEEVICQNIQLTMESTGVQTEYALDGQSALDMILASDQEGRPYDVVLLDWKMPDIDGVQTAGMIRQAVPKEIPILILTSYDWSEIEEAASAAGVNAFLAKPFFLTSFRKKVEELLELEHPNATAEESFHGQNVLAGMHILVAEDNEINAEILREILDMMGATCDICENGQIVLDAFKQSAPEQYDLILMDVQMPIMNGYDATKAIRRLDHPMASTIPMIAMTANAYAEDVRDALDCGMNGHIAKPVDIKVLEQTVRTVLAALDAQKTDPETIL